MSGTGSSVTELPQRQAHRFRRRLTAIFVLVAAVSAGVVASVTFVLAREYRWRSFRGEALEEAAIALALAPLRLDEESFERFRVAYDGRTEADILAVGPGAAFSSSPALGADDVPAGLLRSDEPVTEEARVDGNHVVVVAAPGPNGSRYYFFFSLRQLEDSLSELARVAVASWAVTVAAAGAVGHGVARATLRPVARVAGAAEAIATGDLTARLAVASDDEFGALASSFNHMADEVQALVGKLEEAAHRQRRFTADVAHELRTPLTGMTATASVLGELLDEMPPAVRRSAEVLVGDVRRLRDLVFELLELARLDSATDPVEVEPLRVRHAVDAVVRGALSRREAAIVIEVPAQLEVLAEPVRLRRILSNLVDNALVHGRGTIRVSATAAGGSVEIAVADDGDGIPAADLPHVFDRFYKGDRSRAAGGSGLGLAIARQHARAQGGDLTVSATAGDGATFTLRLPAADDAATATL